jgi:hypothetical protein
LWALGLPVPDQVWDTCIAERAFLLGLHHARYVDAAPRDDIDEAQAQEKAEGRREFDCSLLMTCLRRGVHHPFSGDKERLQRSFLTHSDGEPFTSEQIEYAAADAVAAAQLYPVQAQVAVSMGCLTHLVTVEMPWVITNSRMVWDGVRVHPDRCGELLEAARRHQTRLAEELGRLGVGNPRSHKQVQEFFERVGLLEAFRLRNRYSFDDDQLEAAEDRHPAIPLIRAARKV